ncbi:MAG TPA: glycosyltransferase [Pyrinomonadaceae bacterium]|nr:glycosyltransferase [Pyrinomonadaceae bacterium]
MGIRTLYLCYFGLREPLVQTQVLPYLRQLAGAGIEVYLLTFEPRMKERWNDEELKAERARLMEQGIRWLSLPYHKRPSMPATAYDVLMGAWAAVRLIQRHRIDVLHARAHIAMAMALLAHRVTRCRLIFDIRGLVAEEYADAQVWAEGSLPFRMVKRLERAGIKRADQLVVLTRRMKDWLVEQKLASADEIEVIPCCVDFSRFAQNGQELQPEPEERFVVTYAGSVTGLYLLEEMGRFFLAVRAERPEAFLNIMTASEPKEAAARLESVGLKPDDFHIGAVAPAEVPRHLRRARLGLSFRKPAFSQIAASPTKIAEYLAAGLVVVCNAGVGDMDEMLEQERVGVVVEELDADAYREAARRALALASEADIKERSLDAARRNFDLVGVGGTRYRSVYERIKETN